MLWDNISFVTYVTGAREQMAQVLLSDAIAHGLCTCDNSGAILWPHGHLVSVKLLRDDG